MALPDLSTLTDDELLATVQAAKNERIRRGRYAEVREHLVFVLGIAKEAGATKTQVANFLTSVVNEVYP